MHRGWRTLGKVQLHLRSQPCNAFLLSAPSRPLFPSRPLQATPIFNKIIFSKIKERLGGRVRLIISGERPHYFGDAPHLSTLPRALLHYLKTLFLTNAPAQQ